MYSVSRVNFGPHHSRGLCTAGTRLRQSIGRDMTGGWEGCTLGESNSEVDNSKIRRGEGQDILSTIVGYGRPKVKYFNSTRRERQCQGVGPAV